MNDFIICKPVILPTEDKSSPIWEWDDLPVIRTNVRSWWDDEEKKNKWGVGNLGNRHLYLVSDEDIKEGDWILHKSPGYEKVQKEWQLHKYSHSDSVASTDWRKKIVATTDKSLSLPLIPSSFIERWVNEQGKIDKVRVQIKKVADPCSNCTTDCYNWQMHDCRNYKDEVIILPIEDNLLPRGRVIQLMAATANHVRKNGYGMWSTSASLAIHLYDRWENKESEDHSPLPIEDKMYTEKQVLALMAITVDKVRTVKYAHQSLSYPVARSIFEEEGNKVLEDKTYSREELKKAMLEAAGWGMLLPSGMKGSNYELGLQAFDEWFDKTYPI